jgi:hypothetical protein
MRIYIRKMRIYIHVSIRMFSYLLICVYVYLENGWYIAISDIQTKTMLVLWMKIRNKHLNPYIYIYVYIYKYINVNTL